MTDGTPFSFSFETSGDPGDGLEGLLSHNAAWTDALDADYFADVKGSQDPPVVTVCCSDSRVSQDGMFVAFDAPGSVFTPSNIGNTVTREVDGETVIDGSFLYPIALLDAELAVVVGHTGCGAVTAAYDIATGVDLDLPDAIRAEVDPIVPVVEAALADGWVDPSLSRAETVDRLVECNVHAQVEALLASDAVPDTVDCYGFVYDFQGVYGATDGRTVLINDNGAVLDAGLLDGSPAGGPDDVQE